MSTQPITFTCTACGRPDLLRRTIDSFMEFNDYPIERYIIYEDSGQPGINDELQAAYPQLEIINPARRVGQILAVDSMYARVSTPYIFHCEDDWEFYRKGFIHESIHHMINPRVLQVQIREKHDLNGHPIVSGTNRLAYGYNKKWHGFSFNPGLRRLHDWKRIRSYSHVAGKFNVQAPWLSEARIGAAYRQLNMYTIVTNQGYVRHIGEGRGIRE